MADNVTAEVRSRIMASVKSTGNKSTELAMIALFRTLGVRGWRRGSNLPGRPDFVFRQAKVAVFIDGCFWHGHPTRCRVPAANREYWLAKIARNKARDRAVTKELRSRGWVVVRVWEHELASRTTSRKIVRLAEKIVLPGAMRDGGATRDCGGCRQ